MKYLTIILIGLFVIGCSSNPYESEVTSYFESTLKISPIIEGINIDSSALASDFDDHWQSRIVKRRNSKREFYRQQVDFNKSMLEDIKKENERDLREYGRTFRDTTNTFDQLISYRNLLDSVDLETDPVYETYNQLRADGSKFDYLSVKYKLTKDGASLIQNFVIANDSVVYSTKGNLRDFILTTYFNKKLVANGGVVR